jgi:hypothetical protein
MSLKIAFYYCDYVKYEFNTLQRYAQSAYKAECAGAPATTSLFELYNRFKFDLLFIHATNISSPSHIRFLEQNPLIKTVIRVGHQPQIEKIFLNKISTPHTLLYNGSKKDAIFYNIEDADIFPPIIDFETFKYVSTRQKDTDICIIEDDINTNSLQLINQISCLKTNNGRTNVFIPKQHAYNNNKVIGKLHYSLWNQVLSSSLLNVNIVNKQQVFYTPSRPYEAALCNCWCETNNYDNDDTLLSQINNMLNDDKYRQECIETTKNAAITKYSTKTIFEKIL